MSQLKEILEKERERTSGEQLASVHLLREGTFYRAYEWSAWLLVRCYPDLKVTHNYNLKLQMMLREADFVRYGMFDFSQRCYSPYYTIYRCRSVH